MKERLAGLLHEGNHSIVICRRGRQADGGSQQVLAFDTKGIATLLQIVSDGSALLNGAAVADKVVGKAAAALLILGGASRLHASLISSGALSLLAPTGMEVSYDRLTDHILNRDRSGWCPMEEACRDCTTAGECLAAIREQISKMRKP